MKRDVMRHSGYEDYSLSVKAQNAYDRGLMPLSKFTKDDFKAFGWQESVALAKYLAGNKFWTPMEWHHTSSSYNQTCFYDIEDLVNTWGELSEAEKAEYRKEYSEKKSAKKDSKSGVRVRATWTVWGGSRSHPKKLGEKTDEGILIGDWITFPDGSRKKASGNSMFYWIIKEEV